MLSRKKPDNLVSVYGAGIMVFFIKLPLSLISFLLFVILIPALSGYFLSKRFQLTQNFYVWYPVGSIFLWACSQLVLVPLVMIKASFYLALFIVTLLYFLAGMAGLLSYRNHNSKHLNPIIRFLHCWNGLDKKCRFSHLLTLFITTGVIVIVTVLQKAEFSDVHYIVSAADMIKSGKMFLSNPASGELQDFFPGSYLADLASPWSFQYAFLGAVTFNKPIVAAHLLLPVQIVILCSCIYRLLAARYSSGKVQEGDFFFLIIWMIQLLGCYSIYCPETILMTRPWHSDAAISSIGLPLVIYTYLCIDKESDRKEYYYLLTGVNLALCYMSRTGICLGIILNLAFAFCYSIRKQSIRIMVKSLFCLIPNIIYWCVSCKPALPSFQWLPALEKISNSFKLYTGDQLMIILGVMSVILLTICSMSHSASLVYPVLTALALTIVSLFFGLLPPDIATVSIYWLFPEAFFITLSFLWIVSRSGGYGNRIFAYAVIFIILMVSKNGFYSLKNTTVIGNTQKTDPSAREVYDYILSRNLTPSCYFCDKYVWGARQYSGDFVMPYNYKDDGSLTFAHTHNQIIPEAMRRNFYISFYLCLYASQENVNFIVLPASDHLQARYLKRFGYYPGNRIGDTIIYIYNTVAEREQRQFISDKLNLGYDSFYKALKRMDNRRYSMFINQINQ